MDEFAFWQKKIMQFFHDPPAKMFAFKAGKGGHERVARSLLNLFMGLNKINRRKNRSKPADWVATGADRPVLDVPRGKSGIGTVSWWTAPEITHPLSPGARLRILLNTNVRDWTSDKADDDNPTRDPLEEEKQALAAIAEWDDLKGAFISLWRRYRDELVAADPNDPLWQEMPGESRCPDHSIWDHLKVATALSFIVPHKMDDSPGDEGAREPWMLRVSLGPVGAFIGQARTSRDLWTGSFLLADLAWAAMQPIVERYGPDCIVYPDLRANPRADCWLVEQHRDALRDEHAKPRTFAAVLPDAFVALVPRGGEGHLLRLEHLAAESRAAVEDRWQQLAAVVEDWFAKEVSRRDNTWKAIWDRQHQRCPIHVTWVAVPWRPLERIKHEDSLRGRPLPAQRPDAHVIDQDDAGQIKARYCRLAPWVPQDAWNHYELARDVYAHSRLDYHQMERGFDYALTHHQLRLRHTLREATDPAPTAAEEPGEKCTLCGQREALHDGGATGARLGELRNATRNFWKNKALDPDRAGEERLCAVCATRRFLVKADQGATAFNHLWAGPASDPDPDARDRDGKLRVPFPSTATIAAQAFIEQVVTHPECAAEIAAVVDACRAADLPRTSFPRALPRLAGLAKKADRGVGEFLEYEAEDVLFPEVLDGKVRGRQEDDPAGADRLRHLKNAVQNLRDKAARIGTKPGRPATRIAVIRLDGDRMGQLLLGDKAAIATCWRDVLHPEVLERLKDPNKARHLKDAGWLGLLECKRLMGPSLHAFVSRALGHFSHRIVPWVVEREFSGVVIYAGGDDVLCLAPADEAIDLAARLHQLFSAAWVVDTEPLTDPWAWRRPNGIDRYDQDEARRRFVIPLPGRDGNGEPVPIELGRPGQRVAPHAADGDAREPQEMDVRGALLPMLGSGASLSAGIAIGHYKTPLSVLLRRSKELERLAKAHGRCAVAVGHASRGGDKTAFSLPWNGDPADRSGPAQTVLKTVIEGFGEKVRLPGRLPYKLRQLALSARCGLDRIAEDTLTAEKSERERRLLHGLFLTCIDGPETPATEAAFALWRRGIDIYRNIQHDEDRYTDGLLLCRELARGGEPAEDVP